jgi:hypothetical protein
LPDLAVTKPELRIALADDHALVQEGRNTLITA